MQAFRSSAYIVVVAIMAQAPQGTKISSSAAEVLNNDGPRTNPLLWRDLRAGQSATDVLAAMSRYPEIRATSLKEGRKGKAPDIRVTMNKGGIPIYGSEFTIDPTFTASGALSDVVLLSDSECANQAVDKYQKIAAALEAKYGKEVTGNRPLNSLDTSIALSHSYESEHKEIMTYGFANKDVAVAFVLAFSQSRPPEYVGGGGIAGALYQVSKSLYEAQQHKCDNSGDKSVTYALKYLSRVDFDTMVAASLKSRAVDDRQADDNL